MDGIELLIPIFAIAILFLGLPWLILHHVTKWKQASALTIEDENLLDELHDIARRLDDRMTTIERINAADRDQPARISEIRPEHRTPELRPDFSAERRPQAIRKDI